MPPRDGLEPLSPVAKARLAARIVLAYARVRLTFARRDVVTTVHELRDAPRTVAALDGEQVDRVARAVVRVLRLLPTDSRCLMLSLVLARLLAREGVDARIVIGVSCESGFAAHAWVEHAGRPLLPPGSGFARLVEL